MKTALVTGANKSIGFEVTKQLAQKGIYVYLGSRNLENGLEAVNRLKSEGLNHVEAIRIDVTNDESVKNARLEIGMKTKSLDILINNAGIYGGYPQQALDATIDQFKATYDANVYGVVRVTQAFIDLLKKSSEPRIVNVSSKTAETGQGGTSAYAAANGGRNALTREWAVELLQYGIRVNSVVVAECYTPMYEKWIQSQENAIEKLKTIQSRIPLGQRFTTPKEIAQTVCFLLSEVSSHTTGQLIHVDGGYVHLDRALK